MHRSMPDQPSLPTALESTPHPASLYPHSTHNCCRVSSTYLSRPLLHRWTDCRGWHCLCIPNGSGQASAPPSTLPCELHTANSSTFLGSRPQRQPFKRDQTHINAHTHLKSLTLARKFPSRSSTHTIYSHPPCTSCPPLTSTVSRRRRHSHSGRRTRHHPTAVHQPRHPASTAALTWRPANPRRPASARRTLRERSGLPRACAAALATQHATARHSIPACRLGHLGAARPLQPRSSCWRSCPFGGHTRRCRPRRSPGRHPPAASGGTRHLQSTPDTQRRPGVSSRCLGSHTHPGTPPARPPPAAPRPLLDHVSSLEYTIPSTQA